MPVTKTESITAIIFNTKPTIAKELPTFSTVLSGSNADAFLLMFLDEVANIKPTIDNIKETAEKIKPKIGPIKSTINIEMKGIDIDINKSVKAPPGMIGIISPPIPPVVIKGSPN